jgi:hypothetical protein
MSSTKTAGCRTGISHRQETRRIVTIVNFDRFPGFPSPTTRAARSDIGSEQAGEQWQV